MNKILGDLLKKTREEKNLSLDDVARETKIQKRYIIDLETEEFEDMPGKVYERGFLRTYICLLELEEDKVLEIYDTLRNGKKEEEIEDEVETEKNQEHRQKKSKLKIFIGLIVILSFAFGTLKIMEFIDTKDKKQDAIVVNEEDKNVETVEQKSENSSANIPQSEIELVDSTASAIVPVVSKKIEIKLSKKTWIQVFINGKREKEGEFESSEPLVFQGAENDQIFVKIGNIDNAEVFYNGQIEDEKIAYRKVWKKTF